jgi:hypothetical protein
MTKKEYALYCIERAQKDYDLFNAEPQLILGWTYTHLRWASDESMRHAQRVVEALTGNQTWLNTTDELREWVEEYNG